MGVGVGSISLLEPILDVLPSPKLLVEPGTGRVVYANPAAHRLAGGAFPLAGGTEEYPETYAVFDESGRELPADEHPAVRAARGERLDNVHVDWVSPVGRRSLLVSADTVARPGVPEVVVITFEDVTELQDTRRRTALLADAGAVLGSSLDPDEVAAAVANAAVPAYADWAFVELLKPDGSIVREAMACADPAKWKFALEYDRTYPWLPSASTQVTEAPPLGR
jgi:hypothetical protein